MQFPIKLRWLFMGLATVGLLSAGLAGSDDKVKLRDLAPQDPIAKYMDHPASKHRKTNSGRSPASTSSSSTRILRPDLGQGEHMLYGTFSGTFSDTFSPIPRFATSTRSPASHGPEVRVLGVCRDVNGVAWTSLDQRNYGACLEPQNSSGASVIQSSQRQAGVYVLFQ